MLINKREWLLGGDPEVFLRDGEQLISAHGVIPGTKEAPHKVNKGAVQVDGMALEFNIDPVKNGEEFRENIDAVLAALKGMIGGYELEIIPVANFGNVYIEAQPDEAKELGCDPDYNAWSGDMNPRPKGDGGFRTAAGHIHIGWTQDQDITHPDHILACRMLVKQLDYSLGLPSLYWDKDAQRRKLYGRAGAYRVKPYGVEYRSLSNAWLKDPWLIDFVYNQTIRSIRNLLKGRRYYESSASTTRGAINYSRQDDAEWVLKEHLHSHKILMRKDLKVLEKML